MGNTNQSQKIEQPITVQENSSTSKKKPGPCCVCKDTKNARDICIRNTGDENACTAFIEAHKQCLRANGFSA